MATGASTGSGSDRDVGPAGVGVDRRRLDLEVVAAVVLSVVTIVTAWSAFQSTKWGGIMSIHFSEAAVARTTATQATETVDVKQAIDAGLYVQYVAAVAAGEADVADDLEALFRDEFRPAFEAWSATDPVNDPTAPRTPFEMDEYRLAEQDVIDQATATADERGAQARRARHIADNYVMLTVLSASVLFFAGVSTKFTSERVQRSLLGVAAVLLVVAVGFLVSFPIRV